jgi:hypothetical protein
VKNHNGHDSMMDYVINNIDHFKELTSYYKTMKEVWEKSDPIFKEEINAEYKNKVKYIICTEISRALACSYEDVIIFYEDKDLEFLFN